MPLRHLFGLFMGPRHAQAAGEERIERLQVMLTAAELRTLDDFRFKRRMPSRAAAIRELLRRGLTADGFEIAPDGSRSSHFGVIADGSGAET